MNLPPPPAAYDRNDQTAARRELERADGKNQKRGQDIEVGSARLILTAPDGSRWAFTVDNTGMPGTELL